MPKKLAKKGYFGQFYERDELSTGKQRIYADSKRSKSPGTVTIRRYKKSVKIPDCGWGSETKKLKGPFKNLTDVVTTRYWDKFVGMPDGYVLIQKKHLDEAIKAMRYVLGYSGWIISAHGKVMLKQALKNISVK